jgi:peptide deformylase
MLRARRRYRDHARWRRNTANSVRGREQRFVAILKIARMGHPVLSRRADTVADPTAPEIARLVADMWETMRDAPGIGLAAPQVHVPLRIVVFAVPAHRLGEAAGVPPTVLINPEITPVDSVAAADWEACLSVPGMTGRVRRWLRIRYRGSDLDGRTIDRVADGFHARVVQHECDHLDGILYPMRIEHLVDFGFADEIRRAATAAVGAGELVPEI